MRLWLVALAASIPGALGAGEFYTLKGHGGPIMDIAVSSSGQVATASFDNAVGLWEGKSPLWLDGHEAAVGAVVFAGDGRVVSGGDDYAVRLWSPGNHEPVELGRHTAKVVGLAVSPDGQTVAAASWDARIGLWPVDGGEPRFLTGHDAGVSAVEYTDDGARLLSASVDGSLREWDVALGRETRTLLRHGFGINKLVVNEDQGWLAYGAVDGVVRIVDLETAGEISDFTLGRRPILAMALSRDGTMLATGDGEGYISIVSTEDWAILSDFRATTRGPIWALEFTPDGGNIHAGGLDEAMYSWPVEGARDAPKMDVTGKDFLQGTEVASNGERQFKRKCSICHALGPDGQRRAGPTLHGLFGRPAGKVPEYSYSETLLNSEIVWDDHTVDQLFDLGPDVFIMGTKMPMQRITKKQDRDDLIAFLRQNTAPEGD